MTVASHSTAPDASALAPFRRRAFFWLWLGMVIASMATWMQTVGAQWLLVEGPHPAYAALVQAATALPMMLLALPSGVLADALDKRWMLVAVQGLFVVLGVVMAVMTAVGVMSPLAMLLLTVAWGAVVAMQIPAWQATIPELVPRQHLRAAVRLDMISINVSRAAGPALAGFIIAFWGVPQAFAAGSLLVLPLAAVLLGWRRSPARSEVREPFWTALRAGAVHVMHDAPVRTILLRCFLMVLGASAMWSLLPLVAKERLGVDASGFGVMYTAIGLGAVSAAFGLAGIKDRFSANTVLAAASLMLTLGLAGLVVLPNYWLVLLALMICGFAWMAGVSTINGDIALALPARVRARGMAINMVMFTAAQVLGAFIWGPIAEQISLRSAMLGAAGWMLATIVIGTMLRLPRVEVAAPA